MNINKVCMFTADEYVTCKNKYKEIGEVDRLNPECKLIFEVLKKCMYLFPETN